MTSPVAGGTGAVGAGAPSKWWTLVAVCLGLGMLMVDMFVVNVALPAIGRDLDAGLGAVEWTVSGYVLMLAVLPVAMGRLGDIFGRRRVYLIGLAVFIAASAGCGAARSILELVLWRLAQGAGAAVMMPGTLAIITHAFPPQQRGLAIGLWGGVSGLGLIAGPLLGGLLVQGDDWRPVFLVNLPLGLVALALTLRFVPESRDPAAARVIDWPGLVLLTGALSLTMFGLTRAADTGWSPEVVGYLLVGLGLLPLFVAVERRLTHPLVDLTLFRDGTFVASCLSAFLFSAAVFGSQPFTSLFMQHFWGFTPLEGGLAFVPATFLVATMMPVSGVLGQRLGPRLRLVVIVGSVAVALSFLYLLRLDRQSGYLDGFLPAFLLRGAGIGLVMSASSLAVMSAAPPGQAGLASGTFTLARNAGTALGVVVFGAVFAHHVDREVPAALVGLAGADPAAAVVAAERFLPVGSGPARAAVEQVILDGFVRLALAGAAMSLLATLAATRIRHRLTAPARPVPAPPARPIIEVTGEG